MNRRTMVALAVGALLFLPGVATAQDATPSASHVASPVTLIGTPTAGEEVTFALSDGSTTQGVVDLPAVGTPPFPAVLLIPGAGITDRDETIVNPDGSVSRPFAQIAQELASRGIAVFRYDKRGVCPPAQLCDPAAYGAQTKQVLIADAALAYARMIADPRVDPSRTGVLGHSDGTWFAPGVVARYPEIRALVLMGTGLGRRDVLHITTAALPLLGVARFDANDDGALEAAEVPFADPAAFGRFQQLIRTPGKLFLLRYDGSGADLRPVGLNPKLDANGDVKLDFVSEVRPVYEALYAQSAAPAEVVKQFADPSVQAIAIPAFEQTAALEGALDASFANEAPDQQLRALLAMPSRPLLLIVNGGNDDQTPASSAEQLAQGLVRGGYAPAPTLRIYPGLSHSLSPQADIFAPYGNTIEPRPLQEIGAWLAGALDATGATLPSVGTPVP